MNLQLPLLFLFDVPMVFPHAESTGTIRGLKIKSDSRLFMYVMKTTTLIHLVKFPTSITRALNNKTELKNVSHKKERCVSLAHAQSFILFPLLGLLRSLG